MKKLYFYFLYTVEILKREKERLILSILAGFIVAFMFSLYSTYTYSENIQKNIADKVVRFHVLANSNSSEDIELKYKVRDALLKYTENFDCNTRDEFIDALNSNMEGIEDTVKNTLIENNSDYTSKVFLSRDIFPYKEYGDVVFPAGEYLGLRVEIGEAKGDNWWCVMFPSMCFNDDSCKSTGSQGMINLKNALDNEEYSIVTAKKSDSIVPKMKFKIVELWQESKYNENDFVTNSDK